MFSDFKTFLATTPILTQPTPGAKLLLYLAISYSIISLALFQEEGKKQKSIYYTSRVLQGA